MKLCGRLLPLDVGNEQNTKETPSSHDQYHLTKQEMEDLVGCGALSSVTDSEHNVRRIFSKRNDSMERLLFCNPLHWILELLSLPWRRSVVETRHKLEG